VISRGGKLHSPFGLGIDWPEKFNEFGKTHHVNRIIEEY
jgi:hypothetical protein